MKLRPRLFRWHLWIGLHFGLLLGVLFLTGTLLVFSREIEVAFHPFAWAWPVAEADRASFGAIHDAVRAAYPDTDLQWIERSPAPWLADTTVIRTAWGEMVTVWTDPATGAVRGATPLENFRRIVLALHESLLAPSTATRLLMTAMAPVLVVALVSGLVSYRRFWRGFFRAPSAAAGRRGWLGQLHRLVALWVLPLLLVASLTGLVYFARSLGYVDPGPVGIRAEERATWRVPGLDAAGVDAAAAVAAGALPGTGLTKLSLPVQRNQGLRFEGRRRDTWLAEEGEVAVVDPAGMRLLAASPSSARNLMARIEPEVNSLHFGRFGGTATRVLWLVMGLGATGLVAVGLMIAAERLATAPAALPASPRAPAPYPAAASASPRSRSGRSAAGRVFRAMGIFGWLYAAMLVCMLAAAAYQYGYRANRWMAVPPPAGAQGVVQLQTRGAMRLGRAQPMRVLLADAGVTGVTVTAGAAAPAPLETAPAGRLRLGDFTLAPETEPNDIRLTLTRDDGSEQSFVFPMGRAIW